MITSTQRQSFPAQWMKSLPSHVFWSSAQFWHSHRNRHNTSQKITKHSSVSGKWFQRSNAQHLAFLQWKMSEMEVYRTFSSEYIIIWRTCMALDFDLWVRRLNVYRNLLRNNFPCQEKRGSLCGTQPNNPTRHVPDFALLVFAIAVPDASCSSNAL